MRNVATKQKSSKNTGPKAESGLHVVAPPPESAPKCGRARVVEAENLALRERGDYLIRGSEKDCSLADVISTALGVYTDETIERQVLRTISNELHILHDGLLGGEMAADSTSLEEYIYALAERARASVELGRRFERSAKATAAPMSGRPIREILTDFDRLGAELQKSAASHPEYDAIIKRADELDEAVLEVGIAAGLDTEDWGVPPSKAKGSAS